MPLGGLEGGGGSAIIEVANYKKSNPNFLLDTDNPYYNLKFHIGDINITLKEI